MPNTTIAQSGKLILDQPSDEERQSVLSGFFGALNEITKQRRAAVAAAEPALARLVGVMRQKTGQSYYVRGLLYSLWNGFPTDLSNVLLLDWKIRQDVCAVILAFGFEEPGMEFFYRSIETVIKGAGLFDWFCEAEREVAN